MLDIYNEVFDVDLLIEEKAFDVDILKTNNELETNLSLTLIALTESDNNDTMKEVFIKFKEEAKNIIDKIIDALVKFFKDVMKKIDIKVQQIQLNKKLEELKDIMAKKKAKVLGSKFNYFDIKKYKKFYTEFINRYVEEVKKGLNQDFKNVDEYTKWRTKMMNELADFDFKLSDEEQWKLSVSINSAIELSDEEAKNREKNLEMVKKSGSAAMKSLHQYYNTLDFEKSFANYNHNRIKIFKLHNSFIGMVCSKLLQLIKTVVRIISKHTFACITALLVILIAA